MVWLETKEYLLPRDEVLVMLDLDADFVVTDPDATFEEIPQIHGVDDFPLEQIADVSAIRLPQMKRNILRSYTQDELLPL